MLSYDQYSSNVFNFGKSPASNTSFHTAPASEDEKEEGVDILPEEEFYRYYSPYNTNQGLMTSPNQWYQTPNYGLMTDYRIEDYYGY